MTDRQTDQKSLLRRIAQSVKIVPLVLAIIGAGLMAYGLLTGSETPTTFGAALIGIAIVAQISGMMRQGQR